MSVCIPPDCEIWQIGPYGPCPILNPQNTDLEGSTRPTREEDPFGLKNHFPSLKAQQRKIGHDVDQITSKLSQMLIDPTKTGSSLSQVASQEQQRLYMHINPQSQNQHNPQGNSDNRALKLAQIDQGISDLQLGYPAFIPDPFREHAAHVATAASAVNALNRAVDYAITGAVTGLVKSTHAVCSSHPVLQKGCNHIAEGGTQFLDSIQETAEAYWNGSSGQQGLQAVSSTLGEQYRNGSRIFNKMLAEQNLSPSEAKKYKEDLKTVGGGVVLCASFGGVGLLSKTNKLAKAAESAKSVQSTSTAAASAQHATRQLVSKPKLLGSSEPLAILNDNTKRELTRASVLEKQQVARRNYEHAMRQEQTLLSSRVSFRPFAPPAHFPTNINLFYRECTPHRIKGAKLGAQGTGSIDNIVLSVTNDDHMLFLIKNRHNSQILGERNITILGPKGRGLSTAERIDFTVREALRIAQETGAKRVSFAWDSAKQPVASTLLNQGHSVIGQGTFSRGLHQPPFELIEILLPKVTKP